MEAQQIPLQPHIFIVKAQLSLSSSLPVPSLLVYTRDRGVYYETLATPDLIALFPKGEHKIFLRAVLREDNQLQLHNELLPDQGW